MFWKPLMKLTDPPLPRPVVAQISSTHQKYKQTGDQRLLMESIVDHPTRIAERENSTYTQLVNTANMHRQPFTPNIAQL